MRRPRVAVGLLATACLLLGGCGKLGGGGVADSGVDYSKLGTPVPRPSEPYATPKPPGKPPGKKATPTDQILYDLRQRVVGTAGIPISTDAGCVGGDITGTVDQTTSCTVEYEGLKVTYEVEITGGSPTFSWVATTEQGLLTAEGVGLAYWAKFGEEATVVRCDPMPRQKVLPLGKDTGYRCYHKGSGGWQEHAVVLSDGKIDFVAPTG